MIIDCAAHEDQRPPLLYHVNDLIFPLSLNRCVSAALLIFRLLCSASLSIALSTFSSIRCESRYVSENPHLKQFSFVSVTFSFRIHHPLKLFARKTHYSLCQMLIYIELWKLECIQCEIIQIVQRAIKPSRQNADKFYVADLMSVWYGKWSTISRIKRINVSWILPNA